MTTIQLADESYRTCRLCARTCMELVCTVNNSVEVKEYMRKQEPAREVCFHATMNKRGMLNGCIHLYGGGGGCIFTLHVHAQRG